MMEKDSPVAIAGQADYQAGAVVSRTLLEKPAGTVTIFAFDRGQGLSEHTAPFDALVQVLEGRAEITISGRPRLLEGGDAMIMPAGEPHSLRAVERFKMLLTMIRSQDGGRASQDTVRRPPAPEDVTR